MKKLMVVDMATAKNRKKWILYVAAAMLAFALLALALNASWVEDILNPIPPEELAEIEKAFDEAYMVLNADVTEAIALTPEEQKAIQTFAHENNLDNIKFSHLLLIDSAQDYKQFPAAFSKKRPRPTTAFVEASEDCQQEFSSGEYILYFKFSQSRKENFVPMKYLPSRVSGKLSAFLNQHLQYRNKTNLGKGYQSYIPACTRSGPIEEREADDSYGRKNRKMLDSTWKQYRSEPL